MSADRGDGHRGCDQPRDDRRDEIEAILARGRRTRTPLPRWLWIAGLTVGAICATGFAVALIRSGEPAAHPQLVAPSPSQAQAQAPSPPGAGFATGVMVGGAAGVAIGLALARARRDPHRRDHSSRSMP
jgi:hypothetical protein